MLEITIAVVSCVLLFMAMVLLAMLGDKLGRLRPGSRSNGSSVATGAVFGLLGLLLAFTYAGAFSRFDSRRDIIVQEVNAVGTAYRFIDLLPPERQPALREKLRDYTLLRHVYHDAPDLAALAENYARTTRLQDEIWRLTVQATESTPVATRSLLVSAVAAMFDVATIRRTAALNHHPLPVLICLFTVALIASLLAGYSETRDRFRLRVQALAFAAVVSFSVYIIVDLDYPRYGLINLDEVNAMMRELFNSM